MKASRFATFELTYRIAWTLKDDEEPLDDVERTRIGELLEAIATDHDLELLERTVRSDHVVLTVSSPPRHSPKIVANWLKGLSASKYNRRYEDDGRTIRWSEEYLLASVRPDHAGSLEAFLEEFLDDNIDRTRGES